MTEYISREDVLKKAKSSISVPTDNEWDCGYNTAMAEMQEFIKQLPPSDVQPVNRGEWINEHLDDDVWWAECSNCKEETHSRYGRVSTYKYCPNCGANMKTEVDE